MRNKLYLIGLVLISFFAFSRGVNADTIIEPSLDVNDMYYTYSTKTDFYNSKLLEYYNANLSNDYSYYITQFRLETHQGIDILVYDLIAFNYDSDYYLITSGEASDVYDDFLSTTDYIIYRIVVNTSSDAVFFPSIYGKTDYMFDAYSSFSYTVDNSKDVPIFQLDTLDSYFYPLRFSYSSFGYSWYSSYYPYNYYDSNFKFFIYNDSYKQTITFNDYTFTLSSGIQLQPTIIYLNTPEYNSNLIKVDLNKYAYVILNLKDYNIPATKTQVFVKGNVCFDTLYNFGVDNDVSKSDTRCLPKYDELTKLDFYILNKDLTDNAVYYFHQSNELEDNELYFNSQMFDINYISHNNKDNPTGTINGEEIEFTPIETINNADRVLIDNGTGNSCAIGDINCTVDTLEQNGITTDGFWSNPLGFFRGIVDGVTSFFSLVFELFGVLPPIMQNTLYFAFFMCVLLGVIKIIR